MHSKNDKANALRIMIHGPDSIIECWFSKGSTNNAVLILPPHPILKATLGNPVVTIIHDAFSKAGFSTFRINYRGVGASQGNINDSYTHIEDAMCCVDWISEFIPDSSIKIAGFGYGAYVALNVTMRRPSIDGFVAITPHEAENGALNMLTPIPNGLIVHGSKDSFINYINSKNIALGLLAQKGCSVSFKTLKGDHTFSEVRQELLELVYEYVKTTLMEQPKRAYVSKL